MEMKEVEETWKVLVIHRSRGPVWHLAATLLQQSLLLGTATGWLRLSRPSLALGTLVLAPARLSKRWMRSHEGSVL